MRSATSGATSKDLSCPHFVMLDECNRCLRGRRGEIRTVRREDSVQLVGNPEVGLKRRSGKCALERSRQVVMAPPVSVGGLARTTGGPERVYRYRSGPSPAAAASECAVNGS